MALRSSLSPSGVSGRSADSRSGESPPPPRNSLGVTGLRGLITPPELHRRRVSGDESGTTRKSGSLFVVFLVLTSKRLSGIRKERTPDARWGNFIRCPDEGKSREKMGEESTTRGNARLRSRGARSPLVGNGTVTNSTAHAARALAHTPAHSRRTGSTSSRRQRGESATTEAVAPTPTLAHASGVVSSRGEGRRACGGPPTPPAEPGRTRGWPSQKRENPDGGPRLMANRLTPPTAVLTLRITPPFLLGASLAPAHAPAETIERL
ncbi:hypothetical protein MTO96_010073 [Rhipicephalus appendiculatus]